VRHVIERERIKREGQAEPLVDRSQLSMTAQQKLDAALRQYKQRLDADFSNRVNARVREFLQQFFLSTAGGRSKPNRAGLLRPIDHPPSARSRHAASARPT
jgi:peptidoglycan hydrolase-like protein with peptidoglycan-binding domain